MTTAAVILVGGKSSRMGQNKALLPWQGGHLVDYVARVLHDAGIKEVYVSGGIDGYPNIADALSSKGPVGGICSSIDHLKLTHSRLVFVPVDMPLLSAECVRILLEQEYEACYFVGHPLPCVLPLTQKISDYAQRMMQHLENGDDCSVKQYLDGLDAHAVAISAACHSSLTNTNTPQEWQEATHESAH